MKLSCLRSSCADPINLVISLTTFNYLLKYISTTPFHYVSPRSVWSSGRSGGFFSAVAQHCICPRLTTMTRFYAGIGARNTPRNIQDIMTRLATKLEKDGWILRSGAAEGADSAFERGVINPQANAEIYLPWYKFPTQAKDPRVLPRIAGSQPQFINYQTLPTAQAARQTVSVYHPNSAGKPDWWFDLMARNAMQVLGRDLKTPATMVIAFTKDGQVVGGTGQALRMAQKLQIPIRNLGNPQTLASVQDYLR